jgi:hypothetical protein
MTINFQCLTLVMVRATLLLRGDGAGVIGRFGYDRLPAADKKKAVGNAPSKLLALFIILLMIIYCNPRLWSIFYAVIIFERR